VTHPSEINKIVSDQQKKVVSFFSGKNRGDTRQLPPRVTPTPVTPLGISNKETDFVGLSENGTFYVVFTT